MAIRMLIYSFITKFGIAVTHAWVDISSNDCDDVRLKRRFSNISLIECMFTA